MSTLNLLQPLEEKKGKKKIGKAPHFKGGQQYLNKAPHFTIMYKILQKW